MTSYVYFIILTNKEISRFFYFIFLKKIVYGGMEKMSLSFKVDPQLKNAIEDLAKQENRSLSNYVVTLLMKHLKEKGIDWQKGEKSD